MKNLFKKKLCGIKVSTWLVTFLMSIFVFFMLNSLIKSFWIEYEFFKNWEVMMIITVLYFIASLLSLSKKLSKVNRPTGIFILLFGFGPLFSFLITLENYKENDFLKDMMGDDGYSFYCKQVNECQPVSYLYIDGVLTIAGDDFIFEMKPHDSVTYEDFYTYKIIKLQIVNFSWEENIISFPFKRSKKELEGVWNSPKAQFLFSQNEG